MIATKLLPTPFQGGGRTMDLIVAKFNLILIGPSNKSAVSVQRIGAN